MSSTTLPSIYLVDDEFLNRDMLSRRLEKHGFLLTQISSGKEAILLIEKNAPELVLLDIMMPDMDGIETLQRIREKHSVQELPVIMVTAKDASADIVEALKLGANDYITKPVDLQVALARIRTQLALRNASLENAQYAKRTDTEMKIARTIHRALLPSGFPLMENFSFGLAFQPCFSVGGDFFEIVKFPQTSNVGVLFADISGHGVAGAILAAMFKAWVILAFREYPTPADALRWLNERISEDFPEGFFVCVFFILLNDETGTVSYFNATPDPALLRRADGTIERITDGGRPLGLFSGDLDDDEIFTKGSFILAPEETIFLFTDGLSEMQMACGKPVGLNGVVEWINTLGNLAPQEIADGLLSRAHSVLAGRAAEDDLMIMAIQRK